MCIYKLSEVLDPLAEHLNIYGREMGSSFANSHVRFSNLGPLKL